MSNINTTSRAGGTGIGRGLVVLGAIEVFTVMVALIVLFSIPSIQLLSVAIFLIGTLFVLSFFGSLISAKHKALAGRPVSFWGGFASIVAWNPTEGVLFLKNKHLDFVDSDSSDGGGIRVIFPHIGEELVLRVPLEIQTLSFEDSEILTREYMPLAIKRNDLLEGSGFKQILSPNKQGSSYRE